MPMNEYVEEVLTSFGSENTMQQFSDHIYLHLYYWNKVTFMAERPNV